jgi:prepilin signal peptidase PulO-like enzyme (type II secretory pathway)
MALLVVRLVIVFLAGACLGSFVNWAIYTWAWCPRPISPWSRGPAEMGPRTWADRVPIAGWLRLRREASVHGARFWWRPMLLELALGAGLAALYWWEVVELGLIRDQLGAIAARPPAAPLHWEFVSHTVLICWMLAASFIDIDEKIIPDEITVTGTLLGLLLATVAPISLLPHVSEQGLVAGQGVPAVRLVMPGGAPAFGPNGGGLWLEPVTCVAPQAWPPAWGVPRSWPSLCVGLACYWLWCFAIAPRIWRGRRGPVFALRLIASRLRREFARPPLRLLIVAGSAGIVCVWAFGEERWCGLLTALVGLVGSGGLVWAVRLIGTAALRREAMGFGDVTLMMMVGTFLGWQACIFAFFLAPFAGLLVGIAQFVLRRDDVIPYGPFLCLGATAVIVKWGPIWMWGQQLFVLGGWIPALLAFCLLLLGGMLMVWRMFKEAVLGIR